MKAYLVVTSAGVTTYSDPPDSVCTLVATFKSEIHPDHPLKDLAVLWDLPHPEFLNKAIATKTDEEKWKPWTDIPNDVLQYLNQNFNKSARDYPS